MISEKDYAERLKRYRREYIKDIEYFNIELPKKIKKEREGKGYKTQGINYLFSQ